MKPSQHRSSLRLLRFGPIVSCFSLVALAACGGINHLPEASTRSAAIPWIATPGHALQGLQAQSAHRPCGPGDLRISAGSPVEFQGSRIESLRLTNVSATACDLSSPPTVTLRLASGGTTVAADGAYSGVKVDLDAGQFATLAVGAPATCASYNPAAPKLASPGSAALPGGGVLTVSNASQLDLQCGPAQVVLFFAANTTSPPTNGEPALQVTLYAPSSVSVGTTYQYTVTLTNPTDTTISLLPCPSYTEGLTGTHGILNSETYVLNCQSVGQLAPGASATFQISYPIPATLSPGPAKFWWQMQVPGGPLGGRVVQVS
jgi:hypothetical protein